MLTGEFKNKVDNIWETFWTGGITNPLSVIEQITYLLFMKQLDEQQTKQERRARLSGGKITNPIFTEEDHDIRWSNFKNKTDAQEMFDLVKDKAFQHMKELGGKDSKIARHLDNAVFIIPTAQLLQRVVTAIDKLLEEMTEKNKDTMGDLYEYLLSKLSTSGTNGQFRTPRHIIKMMVELMQPSLGDKIVDPAAGTAGFLVAAAEYITKNFNEELFIKSGNESLQNHYKKSMFYGFDTDQTMLRIASMNLMLHGIEDPNMEYKDSLSKGNLEEEQYTLVLANPPFKGSLDYSEVADNLLAKVKTKKTELLFLALMLRLLKNGGRCVVIVPDGVLFGSSKAHVAIRKEIIENHKLEAVISMPSGVFKPYAGVSTAIMIFQKTSIGGTDQVWFYDMLADGYSLDDNRRELDLTKHEENNIPDIINRFHKLDEEKSRARTEQSFFVSVEEIRSKNYDLSIKRYKKQSFEEVVLIPPGEIFIDIVNNQEDFKKSLGSLEQMLSEEVISKHYETVTLKDISKGIQYGFTQSATDKQIGPKFLRITDIQENSVNWNQTPYCEINESDLDKYLLFDGDIVVARTGATTGKSYLITNPPKAVFASYLIRIIPDKERVLPEYLWAFMQSQYYWNQITVVSNGSTQPGVNATVLASLEVKLPSFEIQKKIALLFTEISSLVNNRKEEIAKLETLSKMIYLNYVNI